MSIGSRIKLRREELGYTQPELAELVGVSKGSIGNYESNVSSPNEHILIKLFDVLKCDANYLYKDDIIPMNGFQVDEIEKKMLQKYRTLDEHGKKMVDFTLNEEYERCSAYADKQPTISIKHSYYKVSAGHGFDLNDSDAWEHIEIPDTPEARRADFALTIKGDSMQPIYLDGDIVLVQSQDDVDDGQIGIFLLNGAGYIKKKGNGCLVSLNEHYDDIVIAEYDDCRCVGKVIGRV